MLVSATEMLKKAKEGHYAVGQFNINNLEWTKSILLTAQELQSPVILGVSEGAGKYMCGYKTIVGMAKGMVSAMMAAMTAQHTASDALQAFAEGGIVKGSTTMGDNVLVLANAGEMLLNTKQQANLFKLLNSGAVSNNNIEFSISSIKVKGSDLFLALSNHKKITHKTL